MKFVFEKRFSYRWHGCRPLDPVLLLLINVLNSKHTVDKTHNDTNTFYIHNSISTSIASPLALAKA